MAEGAAADSNIACASAIVSAGVCQPKQATAVISTDDTDDTDEDFDSIKECTLDSDCMASDGITAGTCVCGYNKDGKAYCLPHRSDEISKKLLVASYEWNYEKMAYYVDKYNNYVLIKNLEINEADDTQDCLDDASEVENHHTLKELREDCYDHAIVALIASIYLAF